MGYELLNGSDEEVSFFFGTEVNFTLLGGSDPQRYIAFPGDRRAQMNEHGEAGAVTSFSLVNEYDHFRVDFSLSTPARLVYFGVETASNSEGGLERTYQGTCLIPLFPVTLPARGASDDSDRHERTSGMIGRGAAHR